MVRTSDMTSETMATILNVLVWSLQVLADGIYPLHDHNGREFSKEYMPHRARLAGLPLAGGSELHNPSVPSPAL